MTSTKFAEDYTTTKIICYICGCECHVQGSQQHEALCLHDWIKMHHEYEFYAPRQPIPYPDPFFTNVYDINMYNSKAAATARHCNDITPRPKENIEIKKIPALGLKHPNNLIQTKKFVRQDEQEYTVKKKHSMKVGFSKKKYEKPAKTILHEVLVNAMKKFAPLVPDISDPGRIPKDHIYAYHLDELNSTTSLILKPCYIATEQLIKSGLPTHAGLASRRPVQISPKITTI